MTKDIMLEQEKTDDELQRIVDKIIDLCEPLNFAEKWKVIDSVHKGLERIMLDLGMIVVEGRKSDEK